MAADRIVALVVLTACMFGFTSYFQDGTWIFPFPLYEVGMAISTVVLFVAERRKPDTATYLVFSWCFFQLLTSRFVLEIFLNNGQGEAFFLSSLPDIIHGFFCVTFLTWGVVVSLRLKTSLLSRLTITGFAVFSIMYLVALSPYLQYGLGLLKSEATVKFVGNLPLYAAVPLLTVLSLLFIARVKLQPHWHVLLLFTFFYLTKYGTLFFFGLGAM